MSDQEKRAIILAAARSLFLQYGLKKTTVDEIARDAGVGKGTIYLYFKAKEDILLAIGIEEFKIALQELEVQLASLSDPSEKLRAIIVAKALRIFDFVTAYPHALEIFQEVDNQDSGSECSSGDFSRYNLLLKTILEEGVQEQLFTIENIDALVEYINFMSRAFFPPFCSETSREQLLAQVEQFVGMVTKSII